MDPISTHTLYPIQIQSSVLSLESDMFKNFFFRKECRLYKYNYGQDVKLLYSDEKSKKQSTQNNEAAIVPHEFSQSRFLSRSGLLEWH